MRHKTIFSVALFTLFICSLSAPAFDWKAGAAKVKITPDQPMWMSGYASRNKPADGTLTDLYAKSLALEDAQGHRALLITMVQNGLAIRMAVLHLLGGGGAVE